MRGLDARDTEVEVESYPSLSRYGGLFIASRNRCLAEIVEPLSERSVWNLRCMQIAFPVSHLHDTLPTPDYVLAASPEPHLVAP